MDSTKHHNDAREETAAGLISPAASPKSRAPTKGSRLQRHSRAEPNISDPGPDSKDESAAESAAALFPTPPHSPGLYPAIAPGKLSAEFKVLTRRYTSREGADLLGHAFVGSK